MRILLSCFLVFALYKCNAQEKNVQAIIAEFETAANDSVIVSKYSSMPYKAYHIHRNIENPQFENKDDSLIFFNKTGAVLVFEYSDRYFLIKPFFAQEEIPFSFAQIYIDTSKIKPARALILAKQFQKQVDLIGIDSLCVLTPYSDSIMPQCDFGYSYPTYLDPQFNDQARKIEAKKVGIVSTHYGLHVVYIRRKGKNARCYVEYCIIELKKK
ncbi:MAG: hypothetical protein FD123_3496 [Bacteroidetes bacterium]|nr:MAG: hypothetical protein FD123_3496 [Bacteroidota bacterium]